MIKEFAQFKDPINYEIERRFLLKGLPDIEFCEIKLISQYYGVDSVGNFRVRKEVSVKGSTFYITRKKFVSAGINEEDEHKISKEEFKELRSKCTSFIDKKRHILYVENDLKWEVDKFSDIPMIVAEIEIPKLDYDLKVPKEIKEVMVEEITDRKDLSNFALSIKIK